MKHWPSRATCVDRTLLRRRWIIPRKLEHWKSGEIATALRIDERAVYRWWRVYRTEGGLRLKSDRPQESQTRSSSFQTELPKCTLLF
ncbi:MAG: helix-turn-helix domain-containing protein [Candidatus Bathyarchaeia archaeon]